VPTVGRIYLEPDIRRVPEAGRRAATEAVPAAPVTGSAPEIPT
jgi:hypothetical protein